MPRPKTRSTASSPLDAFLQHAAEVFGNHLAQIIGRAQPAPRASSGGRLDRSREAANRKRSSALVGRKLDMSCRVPGCKNRSGGPRWGFICAEHRKKLGKKAQAAAREAWKAKHG